MLGPAKIMKITLKAKSSSGDPYDMDFRGMLLTLQFDSLSSVSRLPVALPDGTPPIRCFFAELFICQFLYAKPRGLSLPRGTLGHKGRYIAVTAFFIHCVAVRKPRHSVYSVGAAPCGRPPSGAYRTRGQAQGPAPTPPSLGIFWQVSNTFPTLRGLRVLRG